MDELVINLKKIMKYLCYFLLLISCDYNPNHKKGERGYDLFKNTPVWNLAKAVQDENIEEIKRILKEEKVNIDYQEETFGNTLLMLSVEKQQYKSCTTLLELGADPNKHDYYTGSTALIDAAELENYSEDNTRFLKLLLSHGANPNEEETGKRQEGNTTRKNPLLVACGDVNQFVSPIDKVKVLVEAGANVEYMNDYKMFPLRKALINEHYDVVLYLIKQGADYKRVISNVDGKDYYICDELRFSLLELDSEKYKQKMELVNYLKQQGIDYRNLPIPEYAKSQAKKMYPENWKEYLKKY